jgi:uridine kinase
VTKEISTQRRKNPKAQKIGNLFHTFATLGFCAFALNLALPHTIVSFLPASTMENRLIGFDDLVVQIEQLAARKPHALIAISGFGGSGKSHLADSLRDHFKIKESQTVRIDCLYSVNPHGPGIFDQSDWTLLARILEDVRAARRLHYEGRDDKGELIQYDEPLPQVVIVEGIRLLQPRFMSSFDISVWIDCPQEFAKERAKTRDRSQGDDEQTVSRWDTDWGPKDREYFDTYRPDLLATYLYKEYK